MNPLTWSAILNVLMKHTTAGRSRAFLNWYEKNYPHLNADPYDPRHLYRYRSQFETGETGEEGHGPSKFKEPTHPNRFIRQPLGGWQDTIEGDFYGP